MSEIKKKYLNFCNYNLKSMSSDFVKLGVDINVLHYSGTPIIFLYLSIWRMSRRQIAVERCCPVI